MPPAYSANQKVRFRLDNGDEVQGEIIKRYSTDIMSSGGINHRTVYTYDIQTNTTTVKGVLQGKILGVV